MKHPTWDDIRRFCEIDGWEPTHAERGRNRRDHDRYVKTLPDGRVLRTKASHGRDEIGDKGLVKHILRDQLEVTEEQFWDAVDNGRAPQRGGDQHATSQTTDPSLPGWLAVNLSALVGLSDDEIFALVEEQAMRVWLDWREEQGRR